MGTPNHLEIAESYVTDELLDSYVEAVGTMGTLDLVLTVEPGTKKIYVNARKEMSASLTDPGVSEELRKALQKPASAHCMTELSFWLVVLIENSAVALPVSGRRLGVGSKAKN